MTHLEDLLAQWWRESYPTIEPSNQTRTMMVAFARYALEHHTTTPTTTPIADGLG